MSSSARVTTPADVLDRLRPDVWVKGGDYARGGPAEAPVVCRYGGEIVLHPPYQPLHQPDRGRGHASDL
jgi:bifunctional ADP-heptose synthase (sugar kinase/adenylyltransferase)